MLLVHHRCYCAYWRDKEIYEDERNEYMRIYCCHAPSLAQKENKNFFSEKEKYCEDWKSDSEENRIDFQDIATNVFGFVKSLRRFRIEYLVNTCTNER